MGLREGALLLAPWGKGKRRRRSWQKHCPPCCAEPIGEGDRRYIGGSGFGGQYDLVVRKLALERILHDVDIFVEIAEFGKRRSKTDHECPPFSCSGTWYTSMVGRTANRSSMKSATISVIIC